jgi:hypothetical protein
MRFLKGTIYGIVHALHDAWLLARLPSGVGSMMHSPTKSGKMVWMPGGEIFRADPSYAEAFDGMLAVASAEELLYWFWRKGTRACRIRFYATTSSRRILPGDLDRQGRLVPPDCPEDEAACITALSPALHTSRRSVDTLEALTGIIAGAPARVWRLDGVDLGASDSALKAIFDEILTRLRPTLEIRRPPAKAKGRCSGLGLLQRTELRLPLA